MTAKKKSSTVSTSKAKEKVTSPDTKKNVNRTDSRAGPSSQSLVVSGVIALLSLAAGILTPPLVSYFDKSHPLGGDNQIQRWISQFSAPPSRQCSQHALSQFLHDEPVEGLHVICIHQHGSKKLIMDVYSGAQRVPDGPTQVAVQATNKDSQAVIWEDVKQSLKNALELRTADDLHQPWALFSPLGERIVDEDVSGDLPDVMNTLLSAGMVLVFEGGQWLWPGVRPGFKRSVDLYSIMPGNTTRNLLGKKKTVVLETLSLKPLIVSVEGFLSPFECDHVQTVAAPMMEYSPVALMDKDKGKEASEWRTSQTAFVAGQDDVFVDLEYRTASLTRLPVEHQEHLQVLRYGLNEHYAAHTDYFDPAYYQQDPDTLDLIQNGKRQRLATVFWYLSDVEKGGETAFPYADGYKTNKHCEEGLRVKPQRGKVIIFYSLTASGRMDILSTHAACPVKAGLKHAANKWVWNGAFDEDEM